MTRHRYPPGAAVALWDREPVEVMEPYVYGYDWVYVRLVRPLESRTGCAILADVRDLRPLTPRAREMLRIARRGA